MDENEGLAQTETTQEGHFPDEIAAEWELAQEAQDWAGGDDGYDDPGEVL